MDYSNSPFHRFFGWQIWALLAVLTVYSLWFIGPGPFGQLAGLAPGMPLEQKGFYTGSDAVAILSGLDEAGRRTKLFSLLCDLPYMILNMLACEALIAFGIRHMKLGGKWNLLFALPIAFLFFDFFEDSFIALTLVSGNTVLGSIAGVFTFVKFVAFIGAGVAALVMGVLGLVAWFKRSKS